MYAMQRIEISRDAFTIILPEVLNIFRKFSSMYSYIDGF